MRHRPLAERPAARRARLPVGFTLAAAFAGAFVVVTLANVLAVPKGAGVLVVALVVGVCSIDAEWLATVGVVMLGWLFVTGFVINRLGELHITGRADASRLALLVAVATTFTAASRPRGRATPRIGGIALIPRASTIHPRPRPGAVDPATETGTTSHPGPTAVPR
jgi:hypothetical protein